LLDKAVNIISFDVPYPPNYGGVIDVFYKLKWLKKEGFKIYLHCFTYGRGPSKELEEICEKVFYYRRKIGLASGLSWLPYTVKSRQSAELEKNLLSNDHPILFEVLHTCYLLSDQRFEKRIKIYRHSNIEHEYYARLAESEKSLSKKLYLKTEAKRLERFERIVNYADHILAVNEEDVEYFKKKYPHPVTRYVPSFHPNDEVNIKTGKGNYILYHGNLGVSENYEAAEWLTENVFSKIEHKVIIAGLNPPAFLKDKTSPYKNIELIANPSEAEMEELISNAHAHCLYTEQATGLKLKLLNVLFKGRFTVFNDKMIEGTRLRSDEEAGMRIANNPAEFISAINSLMPLGYSISMVESRKKSLSLYTNQVNIAKVLSVL
jgi:hypothetical protein